MRALRPGWVAVTVDVAVSLAAALVTAHGAWDRVAPWLPQRAVVPIAVGQGLLLLARRRVPAVVVVAVTVVGVFMLAVGYPAAAAIAASCCAAYALAMHGRRAGSGELVGKVRGLAVHGRRAGSAEVAGTLEGLAMRGRWVGGAELVGALRGLAVVVVAAVAVGVGAAAPGARDRSGVWGSFTLAALVAASWVVGYALRTRRAYVAELRERAARLEAQEGERAARAVVDERLRVARELHDVIGHSISLIAIQAEAATRSVRSNPEAVPAFLGRISAASRQAMAEMRGVLAVLRPDAEARLAPQPGLEQLDELVAGLRADGLPIRLELGPMRLPAGVALAVYRIVQESLTNVLKHADGGAAAEVRVALCGGAVRIWVGDDGAGPGGPVPGAAHGIVGMRERVAAYGGTLRTGARAGGGFEVEASIPLPGRGRDDPGAGPEEP